MVALLLLLVALLVERAGAATETWETLAEPLFVRIDARELPEAAVMALAQDRSGFLWVGTQGGLARFDGYRFRNFLPDANSPTALPDGYVRALLADANGGVWIGSSSSGIVHFDPLTETFRTWRPDVGERRGPGSAAVNAIADAGNGKLWVGGDGGLGIFDPANDLFERALLTPTGSQPEVWCVLVDRSGTVWAGTQRGLFRRERGAMSFVPFALRPGGAPPVVYSLMEDRRGRLWAGSTSTVYAVDAARRGVRAVTASPRDPATLADGQQWSLIEMTPGTIWAGTDSAVSIIDAATLHVRRAGPDAENPAGLTGGRLQQFLRDRSGLVWLANHVGGLLLYNPAPRGFAEISTTRPEVGFGVQGAVAVAATARGHLWVGGFGGRLAEFAPGSARALRVLTVPKQPAIQTVEADPDGGVWIGTTRGVCRLRRDAPAIVCPAEPKALAAPSVYALLREGQRLWVGGSTGLLHVDLRTGRIGTYRYGDAPGTFTNSQVRTLLRDRAGRLWVGTENGLNRLDPDGRIVRFAYAQNKPDGVGPGGMATILEDRRGRIWAGANGGPLNVLDVQHGEVTHVHRITREDGLPHENVDGLGEDARGRIWASTDRGLAWIDPHTLKATALDAADGVTDEAHWAGSVSRGRDGTMYFGGLHGVTIVTPDAAARWTYDPPLVATQLEVGRHRVPVATINAAHPVVELPADAPDFSLDFASLDYSGARALRYAVRLDGYDRDWLESDATRRVATYTHLAPRDYTLEVRGTNRRGVWSSNVLRIVVRALPAWYETWWFRALAILLLIVAAFNAHLIRTAVLRRRQSELETIVEARTRELVEANARFQELSVSDPLTGLRNRRFLAEHLEADVALSMRRYADWFGDLADRPRDADLVVFLIDLDHLKIVNDRFGHQAGDLVLVQIRERLHDVFRDSDYLVRWGGDEFLAVARGSDRNDAATIAERICASVAARAFVLAGDVPFSTTVSVGFASFPFVLSDPQAVSWQQVINIADQALYLAKEAGRNTWVGCIANEQTDPATLLRRLEGSAEQALRAGDLIVVEPARARATHDGA